VTTPIEPFRELQYRDAFATVTGSAASTPPCGFSAVQADAGQYIINFGFQINLRFLAATNAWAPAQPGTPAIFVSARPIDSQTIRVFTYGLSGNPDSCPFYLVVF
jgi:hypothetical protein